MSPFVRWHDERDQALYSAFMLPGFDPRLPWALLVAALVAGAVALVGGDIDAAIVTLVGGAAVALVAAGPGGEPRGDAPAAADTSAALLDDTLDAIADPVLIVGDDGRVASANHTARAALGRHIVGEDARLAIRHPVAAEMLAEAGIPGGTRSAHLAGLAAQDRHWEMRIGTTDDGCRIVQLVDRTAAHAAEKMRVDFVANASHELRTPLASILGYVETLQDEAGADADVRGRFLGIMWDEAQRMQRLIGDLISLSRIEADKYRVPSRPIDLIDLIEEVEGELRETRGTRGRDLTTRIAPGLPSVTGDRPQLSQLLHNLIGNALKYGRAGTPVTVTLDRDEGDVQLSVEDQSEGIAAEHIPRLTERFYRVDAGRSRSLGGTGLGLAIVKHIVERHRGRLTITSEVGRGTIVTVTLPGAPS